MKTTYIVVEVQHHEDIPTERVVERMKEILPAYFSIGTSTANIVEVEVYSD